MSGKPTWTSRDALGDLGIRDALGSARKIKKAPIVGSALRRGFRNLKFKGMPRR